jgi:hypothetical protein
MSHDHHGHDHNHDHDHGHGHDHGSEHIYFDGGGVAGVGFIYVILAIGLITYFLFLS